MSAVLYSKLREPFVAHFRRWIEVVMSIREDRGHDDSDIPLDDVDRTRRLIAREAARAVIEIQNYSEGGGGKGVASWQNWVLGIVGVLIAGGIGATLIQLSDLKSQVARVESKQDTTLAATQQRLEADERRIENLERRVFQ